MESTTMRLFCCESLGNIIVNCLWYICRIIFLSKVINYIYRGEFQNIPNLHQTYVSMTKIANLINSQPELDSQTTHGAQPVSQ